MCECYQIGGRFIAEDPDCPIHGTASNGREEQVQEILNQVRDHKISAETGKDMIMDLW
jgi:hypothetical protein